MKLEEWDSAKFSEARTYHLTVAALGRRIAQGERGLRVTHALSLYELDKEDEALSAMLEAWSIEADPDSLDFLSRWLSDRDSFQQLRHIIDEALQLGLAVPAWRLLGCLHEDLDEPAEATECFERAIELQDKKAYLDYGFFRMHLDDAMDQARQLLLEAVRQGDEKAYWTLANLELSAGDNEAAEKYALTSVERKYFGALIPLAEALARRGLLEEAEGCLQDAVDYELPQAAEALLALRQEKMGGD